MQKNRVVFYIIGISLIASVIFFGIAVVNSIDNLRYQVEGIKTTLTEIQNGALSPIVSSASETNSMQNIVPAANVKYFDPKAESGDRLIRVISADAGNMNYIINNDSTVAEFWGLANSALAERDWEKMEHFEPLMAESWTLSEDKLTYHIKLRPGILWHDFTDPVTGKKWENVEVTAEDFKFFLQVVQDKNVDAQALRGYFSGISQINVINKYEFDVVWTEKYFLSEEITLGLTPLPKHLYHAYEGPFDGTRFNEDHERNKIIVGCGPYRFVSQEKGKRVTFQRFEKYFGKKLGIMPPIKNVIFELIQHPNTRFQALLAQDVDEIGLTPDQWINNTDQPAFHEGGTVKKIQYASTVYGYIGLNLRNPLFSDRRVRVALSHLIDRDRIQNDIYHNLAKPVSGPMFSGSPYYDKTVKPYSFDIEIAKHLLREAGWTDTDGDGLLDKNGIKFSFTVIYPNSNTSGQKLLPIIKEDMAKVGIELNILSLEWSVVLDRVDNRKFESVLLAWNSPVMPDQYQIWHSDNANIKSSSNFISFSNKEADRLISEIRQCFDPEKRLRLYHEFHRLIHEEEPYLFLFSPYSLTAINSRYKNLRIFPLGMQDLILWVPKQNQMQAGNL